MIHAVGINMEKITRKIINYFLVGWKARGLPKGGLGCGLAIKAKGGGESAGWKDQPKKRGVLIYFESLNRNNKGGGFKYLLFSKK